MIPDDFNKKKGFLDNNRINNYESVMVQKNNA